MRFFKWLSGGRSTEIDPSLHKLYPWKPIEDPQTVRLPAEEVREAYIYDARPFRSIKKGEAITLDLFPGRAKLTSTASGTTTTTSDFGNSCLMYEDHPVGFVSVPISELKRAHGFGLKLQVDARVGGKLRGYPGIRRLFISVPHRFHASALFTELARESYGVPESAELHNYNEWDEADYAKLKSRKAWIFEDAKLTFEPVPQGSSAQPHLILSGADGRQISRLTARNAAYKQIVPIAHTEENLFVTAVKTPENSPKVGYDISLFHWS